MKPRKITSLDRLKEIALSGADVFIALEHGLFNRKSITWNPVGLVFGIYNYMGEKDQLISAEQFFDPTVTCLGNAMRLGVLYEGDGAFFRWDSGGYLDSIKNARRRWLLTPERTKASGDAK